MLLLLASLLGICIDVSANIESSPAAQQILNFRANHSGPIGILTTSAGQPVEYTDATTTLNRRLVINEYFMDMISHVVQERIPERVVHAKAGGAFGYFEVTHDISDICGATFLNKVGKKTPLAVRFSPAGPEKGGSDIIRDLRGFAIKFYTQDGNFDIVGLNTPIFGFRDPLLFNTFIHSRKPNPATNLPDVNMAWDFITLQPQSLYMFMFVFGDRGIPDGYRHMPGFSIHTYEVFNNNGEQYYVRFHFYPDAGIKNLYSEQARNISDTNYATRDLYNAIGNAKFPSWTASVQVLTLEDVKNAEFDVFDITRALPLDLYPLRQFGRLVLNRNPTNYFAEIEQLAFSPANLVPGIRGAPDTFFEGRRIAYRAAQSHRLGGNFYKIAVNCPFNTEVNTYNRDGEAPVRDNMEGVPNYYPNSFYGPVPYKDQPRQELINIYERESSNIDQVTKLYDRMTNDEQGRLINNVLSNLEGVAPFLQERAVKLFTIINLDLGNSIAQGLKHKNDRNYDWYYRKPSHDQGNIYYG